MSRRNERLTGLDLQLLELKDYLTIQADQVIVVLVVDRQLVAGLPIPEVALVGDPRLYEQLERAIHGRRPRGWSCRLNCPQKLLYGDVPRADEHLEYLHPLPGVLHPLAVDVGVEPLPR